MNPEVLFWSKNPDLYVAFSHIFAVEGLRLVLLDENDLSELSARTSVAAIVLDTENNAEHALRLCNLIKTDLTTAHIPLLALIPSGDERHYLDLIKAGVNESFVRPTSPARILGYLQSVMSKMPQWLDIKRDNGIFRIGELSLEASQRSVRYGAQEIQIGPIEFKLLYRLLQLPGRVFSRSELIEAAWPRNYYVQPRTVDVHIGRLRRLLKHMTGHDIIHTIRCSGYKADLDDINIHRVS